jgi:hypothetical protein
MIPDDDDDENKCELGEYNETSEMSVLQQSDDDDVPTRPTKNA